MPLFHKILSGIQCIDQTATSDLLLFVCEILRTITVKQIAKIPTRLNKLFLAFAVHI